MSADFNQTLGECCASIRQIAYGIENDADGVAMVGSLDFANRLSRRAETLLSVAETLNRGYSAEVTRELHDAEQRSVLMLKTALLGTISYKAETGS